MPKVACRDGGIFLLSAQGRRRHHEGPPVEFGALDLENLTKSNLRCESLTGTAARSRSMKNPSEDM